MREHLRSLSGKGSVRTDESPDPAEKAAIDPLADPTLDDEASKAKLSISRSTKSKRMPMTKRHADFDIRIWAEKEIRSDLSSRSTILSPFGL